MARWGAEARVAILEVGEHDMSKHMEEMAAWLPSDLCEKGAQLEEPLVGKIGGPEATRKAKMHFLTREHAAHDAEAESRESESYTRELGN